MQASIQYNFKAIPVVPTSNEMVDAILSGTNRRTPTVIHPGYKITRIRKFYMRKVKFTQTSIEEKIDSIVSAFPKIEDIHPFYGDLMNIYYDKDHYKIALGRLNNAKSYCEKIANDYVKLMKFGDTLYRVKQLKVAALGRMVTILKKLNSYLVYLEEVRKHLGRLPSIDPMTRTLILTGYPNVGKSSFMNHLTKANVEVSHIAFTTKALYVGQTDHKFIKWQVIDTPGILDRPLEERTNIEMTAITALAHLDAAILYFIDISEMCGYSIAEQLQLFDSIRPLFKNKPLVLVLNKIDLMPYENLSQQEKQLIESYSQQHNTCLIKMSNETGSGVDIVKSQSCDILLEYRNATRESRKGDLYAKLNTKIYVARPTPRDNKDRPAFVPDIFVQEKLNNPLPEDTLEKKVDISEWKRKIDEKGGEGVFYVPDREHFILAEEEWRNDIAPEIMDGKNVFDFVDPDILRKVQELEALEEQEQAAFEIEKAENNCSDSEIDSELEEAHEELLKNRELIKNKHRQVTGATLPKRVRGLTLTEKFMKNLRIDKQETYEKMEEMNREEKLRKKRVPLKTNVELKPEPTEEEKRLEVLELKKKEVIQRMKKKLTKGWSREARVNETDNRAYNSKPKHLYGKMSKGTRDYR